MKPIGAPRKKAEDLRVRISVTVSQETLRRIEKTGLSRGRAIDDLASKHLAK